MPDVVALLPSLLSIGVLAAIATIVLAGFRIERVWEPALAIVRGAVQLAVISLILSGIISEPGWIGVAHVVMFGIATSVAKSRSGWSVRTFAVIGLSMLAGVGVALVVVFASGALELTSRYALAVGAMLIGNSMSIATLTTRRLRTEILDHWDEVEGWLAVGATPRRSTILLARRAVREALIPAIDQTKTTGLVVLPGAFVGAIFGGLSPLEAGRFQIVVLAAIMAAGSVTAVLIASWMRDVRVRPQP